MKTLRFGALASLFVLFAINLANYMDRYLVTTLAGPIESEFHIGDAEFGLLVSVFVVVYMLASPLCGYVADRVQRRFVISGAVALWSVATALASQATSFGQMLGLRGGVGIGESGYNAAGQALLTDLFPEDKRNRVMAIFNLAMPVGSAIGFALAGVLPPHVGGWRNACLVAGTPGVLLALLAMMLPGTDAATRNPPKDGPGHATDHGTWSAYVALMKDPVFMTNTFGFAMQSFSLGGLAVWATPFLQRTHHMEHEDAALWAGGIVVVSGIVGTALGALCADAFAKRGLIPVYALVTGVGYLVAAPLLYVGLFQSDRNWALGCLFLSMIGSFLGTGPSNAIVAARAPALHRATAFALVVLILHLFGDAASPPLLGWFSEHFRASGMPESGALQQALVAVPIALLLGSFFMFACASAARGKGAAPAPQ